jgi:uncharacterized Zn finger protein
MIKCPNCGSTAQKLLEVEHNYDHSFHCMSCEDCGFKWAEEFDIDNTMVSYQYHKDGIYYVYSSKGKLLKQL